MIPKKLLPGMYQEQWCVAGGYAACPALADDQDVWVYAVPTEDLDAVRRVLLSHLSEWRIGRPRGPFFENEMDTRTVAGYQHPRNVRKVAKVYIPYPAKPIHLLVTDAMAPGEIIEGFDISTHAVAIDYTGRVWKASQFTPPHLPPVKLLDTDTTPERMAKITTRFGHPYKEVSIGEAAAKV
jgi:hypothetical protein